MPLFVHHPEYRCTDVQQIIDSEKEGFQFQLTIRRTGNPFDNKLWIWLNKACTKLSYKMERNPKLAYQLDFSYLSLDNKTASEAIKRYLIHRTNERFTELNGDVFFYILLLSDTEVLDDFLDDPFTFRILAERVKRGQSSDFLVQCNRYTLVLSCLAEHIANFDASLDDVHEAFVEHAWITPAIYRWLQEQPIIYVEKCHVHNTLSHQYQVDCVWECSLFLELLRSPIKQRNRLLSQNVSFSELLESIKAYGPQRRNYKLLGKLSLSELTKLRALVPGQVEGYVRDISIMLVGAMVRGEEYNRPTTATQVVKLHDALVLSQIGDLVIDPLDYSTEVTDKEFPLLPIPSLNFIEPIRCISELREEGKEMRHCIYSATYIKKLLSGNYFAYRVYGDERATLLLVNSFGLLEIDQISGYSNAKVSDALIRQIENAIQLLNQTGNSKE